MAILTRIFLLGVNHVRLWLDFSQIWSACLDSCLPRSWRLAIVGGAAADVTSDRVHAIRKRTFVAHSEASHGVFGRNTDGRNVRIVARVIRGEILILLADSRRCALLGHALGHVVGEGGNRLAVGTNHVW